MSEFLSRLDFAWPWAAILIFLPLLSRYFLPQDNEVKERVRVPFLPELIDEVKLNSQPVRSSKLSGVLFWIIWILLVIALTR
ncbi:VWA domain-containing protein, partial [Rahnella sp. FRB 231]|nr:VWA domain-containing protein [Rahnella ecdela]MBU9843510.1 VWA domain-containing protein [Rahnella ecdela]